MKSSAPVSPAALLLLALFASPLHAQTTDGPRARDLGVPFPGTPGPYNAITDVAGVEVGHATIIEGSGRLVRGEGPVRTGVTAIIPRGKDSFTPVFAAWFPLNGNGEMTGTTWIDEGGLLGGPIMITNTHSVGVVRDAVIAWMLDQGADFVFSLPVVAETFDGGLNDINGFHVRPEHAFAALNSATGGPVEEGSVGGGTGMVCNGFKGGIGTSSRVVEIGEENYVVGVLVQCNYGWHDILRIAGVPIGPEIEEPTICIASDETPSQAFLRDFPRCEEDASSAERPDGGRGSIIIVVATDAPLLPHQLERLVKRATLGLGRNGSIAGNSSGDIFVAFSTANPHADADRGVTTVSMLPNGQISPLFRATVQATEEAVINAMVAAETMTGADYVRVKELPEERLQEILRKYNRLDTTEP